MKRTLALLLLLCSTLATAQLKTLQIGSVVYIGEGSDGTSYFALHLGEDRYAHPIKLASPITFSSVLFALVGANGTLGPWLSFGPYVTPTELLPNTLPPPQGHPCPCLVAAFQMVMSTDPTITIALQDGRTIKTSSTVNVYLEAPHGKSAIQLQQSAPIYVYAVQ